MDGALWLLLRLRLVGVIRRWGRSLRTMKGLLLASSDRSSICRCS